MSRQDRKKRRMIILSLDAVGGRDLAYMETLPNFGPFFKRAAGCGEVVSVYPSLTYPAHVSIVTGRYPKNHGIVNNLQVQPEREPSDWFWQRKYVQGTTLYDEAVKNGCRVASLLWPVMGKARVHYNLPEVLPNRPWQNQLGVCMMNGTPLYELELQMKFGSMREGIRQPQLDHFVHASMLHTLEKYRPDLMLVHLTDVDTNRHLYGLDSPEAMAAIRRHDERLGELLGLLRKMGLEDETDVVILGDHCQLDVKEAIYPNYYFVKAGLAEVKNGRIREWKAIARDCDGCCYIYVKDRNWSVSSRHSPRKTAELPASLPATKPLHWGRTRNVRLCWRQRMGITSRMAGKNTGERPEPPTIIRISISRRQPTGIFPTGMDTGHFLWLQARILQRGPGWRKCHWLMKGRHWPKFWDWIWAGWTGGR